MKLFRILLLVTLLGLAFYDAWPYYQNYLHPQHQGAIETSPSPVATQQASGETRYLPQPPAKGGTFAVKRDIFNYYRKPAPVPVRVKPKPRPKPKPVRVVVKPKPVQVVIAPPPPPPRVRFKLLGYLGKGTDEKFFIETGGKLYIKGMGDPFGSDGSRFVILRADNKTVTILDSQQGYEQPLQRPAP